MLERTFELGPFQANCRIIACESSGVAAIVDPGDEPENILKELQNLNTVEGSPLQVAYLLLTHAHLDHIGAVRKVCETLAERQGLDRRPAIALHPADLALYRQLKMQGEMFGFLYDDPLPVDHLLKDGEVLSIGTITITVIHTPGHSPGGVCFLVREEGGKTLLISGDTLFNRGVGRSDLWGGEQKTLLRSIREKLFVLDDGLRVCPGHGPDTTIGAEKRDNPFVRG